ncbi:MAG: hypothetical protein H0U57_04565 [Tatlockia sp.]|nr:hypothetical protein [Tatlockia sp.]
MKILTINFNELELFLRKKNEKLLNELNELKKEEAPKLVFCAIDNDLLSSVDLIKQHILKQNAIPIIGESALGTWLASNHHQGKKELILRDCLPLINLCEEFTIFVDEETTELNQIISNLADGVIYELAYWFKAHKKASIVNIINYPTLQTLEITPDNLNSIDSLFFKKEVYSVLDKHLDKQNPTLFSMSADIHGKHADWIRMDAYKNNYVPVCPHTMVNKSAFILAQGANRTRRLLNQVSIALKCEKITLYGPYDGENINFENLPLDTLFEAYLLRRFSPTTSFYYTSFREAGVPKYANDIQWAITTKELYTTREEKGLSDEKKGVYSIVANFDQCLIPFDQGAAYIKPAKSRKVNFGFFSEKSNSMKVQEMNTTDHQNQSMDETAKVSL